MKKFFITALWGIAMMAPTAWAKNKKEKIEEDATIGIHDKDKNLIREYKNISKNEIPRFEKIFNEDEGTVVFRPLLWQKCIRKIENLDKNQHITDYQWDLLICSKPLSSSITFQNLQRLFFKGTENFSSFGENLVDLIFFQCPQINTVLLINFQAATNFHSLNKNSPFFKKDRMGCIEMNRKNSRIVNFTPFWHAILKKIAHNKNTHKKRFMLKACSGIERFYTSINVETGENILDLSNHSSLITIENSFGPGAKCFRALQKGFGVKDENLYLLRQSNPMPYNRMAEPMQEE